MIREKVKVSDFDKLVIHNEYFLWNFLPEDMGCVGMYSMFQKTHPCSGSDFNPLNEVLDLFDVPYFESKLEDSIDFVLNSGILFQDRLFYQGTLNPVMIGFKRRRKVTSTLDGICYCPEGVIEIIYNLNPNLIMNVKID